MPIVSQFFGIKIYLYWDDPYPQHFHAQYAEFEIVVNIEDATVIKGRFPSKQLKLTLAWCEIHKDELIKNWELAKKMEAVSKIPPLK
jgi:hypothetical protein